MRTKTMRFDPIESIQRSAAEGQRQDQGQPQPG